MLSKDAPLEAFRCNEKEFSDSLCAPRITSADVIEAVERLWTDQQMEDSFQTKQGNFESLDRLKEDKTFLEDVVDVFYSKDIPVQTDQSEVINDLVFITSLLNSPEMAKILEPTLPSAD